MAKLRINGDSSGYVDLEAPNAASSSTLDLDQVPQKNVANTFSADMSFGDNNKVNLGAGNDLQLYHDGSNNYIKSAAAGWLNVPLSGNGMTVANSNFSNIFFKIDSSGRVTTPQQPSFNAQRTSNQGIQGGTTLIFNQARHNTGNHYNTSTGVFTAPIAGDYLFTFKSLFYAFASSEYLDLYITVNGTTRNRYEQTGNSGQHTEIDYTEIVRLNANDTFYLFANNRDSGATLYSMYANENHFSGYLLG